MSKKPSLGGINAILRKQREEAGSSVAGKENTGALPHVREAVSERPSDLAAGEVSHSKALTDYNTLHSSEIVLTNETIKEPSTSPNSSSSLDNTNFSSSEFPVDNLERHPSLISLRRLPQESSANSQDLHSQAENTNASSETFSLGEKVLKLSLTGNELKLYDYIYRHTILMDQFNCRVNIKDLQAHLGLTQMSVFRILNRLESKQAITRKKIEVNRLLVGIELSLIP